MSKQVLFIQGGGGENGYDADTALVTSLQKALGKDYDVSYPRIRNEESAADFGWTHQIAKRIAAMNDDFILAGHSFGASIILKYLSENPAEKKIKGTFLVSTPFWSGDEDWQKGLRLPENFAEKLGKTGSIFFYHCKDDEEVPFSHLDMYRKKLPAAHFREIPHGGHQLDNDLTLIAQDMKSLQP